MTEPTSLFEQARELRREWRVLRALLLDRVSPVVEPVLDWLVRTLCRVGLHRWQRRIDYDHLSGTPFRVKRCTRSACGLEIWRNRDRKIVLRLPSWAAVKPSKTTT